MPNIQASNNMSGKGIVVVVVVVVVQLTMLRNKTDEGI